MKSFIQQPLNDYAIKIDILDVQINSVLLLLINFRKFITGD